MGKALLQSRAVLIYYKVRQVLQMGQLLKRRTAHSRETRTKGFMITDRANTVWEWGCTVGSNLFRKIYIFIRVHIVFNDLRTKPNILKRHINFMKALKIKSDKKKICAKRFLPLKRALFSIILGGEWLVTLVTSWVCPESTYSLTYFLCYLFTAMLTVITVLRLIVLCLIFES